MSWEISVVNQEVILQLSVEEGTASENRVAAEAAATVATAQAGIATTKASEANQSKIDAGTFAVASATSAGQALTYKNEAGEMVTSISSFIPSQNTINDINYTAISKLNGDFYTVKGFYRHTSNTLISNAGFKTTELIKFTKGETLTANLTSTNASAPNILFLNASKVLISFLTFSSGQNPIVINSANTPDGTAFIALNAFTSNTDTWVEINSKPDFDRRITTQDASILYLQNQDKLVTGISFNKIGYVNKTNGNLDVNASFRSTDYIPFVSGDRIDAFNTVKSASLSNINFYTSAKTFISGLDFAGANSDPIQVDSSNTPANTSFVIINSSANPLGYYILNGKKDLKKISDEFILNNFNSRKWCSIGDSLTAAGIWQNEVDFLFRTVGYVRGVGSSAVSTNFTGVAIKPSGECINRRPLYGSDALFNTALANAGYTNLVTTPTWQVYAANPAGYTLPAGSYFLIDSQGSSLDRAATIPIDSKFVAVMFGTNDAVGGMSSNLGTVDEVGGTSFLGNYKLMLDRIHTRVPSAKIILCIPPKMTSENSSFTRTSQGIQFDILRQGIRDLGSTYGYEVIDFTKVLNLKNPNRIADGIHPNNTGYQYMGKYFAQKLMSINYNY